MKGNGLLARDRERLERLGRGGDTTVGHLTEGEVIVPRGSDLAGKVRAALAALGYDPERYTVGGPGDSINPRTGMREFLEGATGGVGDTGGRGSDPAGQSPGEEGAGSAAANAAAAAANAAAAEAAAAEDRDTFGAGKESKEFGGFSSHLAQEAFGRDLGIMGAATPANVGRAMAGFAGTGLLGSDAATGVGPNPAQAVARAVEAVAPAPMAEPVEIGYAPGVRGPSVAPAVGVEETVEGVPNISHVTDPEPTPESTVSPGVVSTIMDAVDRVRSLNPIAANPDDTPGVAGLKAGARIGLGAAQLSTPISPTSGLLSMAELAARDLSAKEMRDPSTTTQGQMMSMLGLGIVNDMDKVFSGIEAAVPGSVDRSPIGMAIGREEREAAIAAENARAAAVDRAIEAVSIGE